MKYQLIFFAISIAHTIHAAERRPGQPTPNIYKDCYGSTIRVWRHASPDTYIAIIQHYEALNERAYRLKTVIDKRIADQSHSQEDCAPILLELIKKREELKTGMQTLRARKKPITSEGHRLLLAEYEGLIAAIETDIQKI